MEKKKSIEKVTEEIHMMISFLEETAGDDCFEDNAAEKCLREIHEKLNDMTDFEEMNFEADQTGEGE